MTVRPIEKNVYHDAFEEKQHIYAYIDCSLGKVPTLPKVEALFRHGDHKGLGNAPDQDANSLSINTWENALGG